MASNAASGKPSMMPLLACVGGLTIVGAGGGGVAGDFDRGQGQGRPRRQRGTAGSPRATRATYGEDVVIRELSPIVTNLAQPEGVKVRLQASILFNKKDVEAPTLVSAQITDDLIGYLKTLSIAQLQGGSGLQSLREDLNERVATRSNGRVRELIIETLVVQ